METGFRVRPLKFAMRRHSHSRSAPDGGASKFAVFAVAEGLITTFKFCEHEARLNGIGASDTSYSTEQMLTSSLRTLPCLQAQLRH